MYAMQYYHNICDVGLRIMIIFKSLRRSTTAPQNNKNLILYLILYFIISLFSAYCRPLLPVLPRFPLPPPQRPPCIDRLLTYMPGYYYNFFIYYAKKRLLLSHRTRIVALHRLLVALSGIRHLKNYNKSVLK